MIQESINSLVLNEKWDEIAFYLQERFGVQVSATTVESWKPIASSRDWPAARSNCTWFMWFKNRIRESHIILPVGEREEWKKLPGATLHIFFIYLEETDEMLDRLKDIEEPEEPEGTARSKISKTKLSKLHPINTTAAKVAPEFKK